MTAVSPNEYGDDLELRELAKAVFGPLKSAIHSLNKILEILFSLDAEIVLPGCQTFRDIRKEIENMKQQMEKAYLVAEKELTFLHGETVRLIVEQKELKDQKGQRVGELKEIKERLESYRLSLCNYSVAQKALASAEVTLQSQRQNKYRAEILRNVGIGLMFFPIYGWIAGATMVGVGQTDLNRASEAVDTAKKELEKSQSQVNSYSVKEVDHETMIHKAELDIQEVECKIRETEAKLQRVTVKWKDFIHFQAQIRNVPLELMPLCAVANVAELQTRRQILLEPVMKVMEGMITALGQIAGDDLLHKEGIKSLMCDMKKNQKKL